jgi:putative methyltransferase (TIGR04325 family)
MIPSSSGFVADLLNAGRLQEAEWLMRRGADAPLKLQQLAQQLGTRLASEPFFVSPGYYAPLSNWAEAEHCCGDAYQAGSVVESYQRAARQSIAQRNQQLPIDPYTMRQLAALQHTWLAQGRPSTLKVLDFGGAMGAHFHKLERYWAWCRLEWTVCETPAVAAAGAAEFACDCASGSRLRFSDKAAAVLQAGCDLVFASCSLQYLEHWPQMLMLFLSASWVLLDRVPLIDHPTDLIAIQVVPASYTDTRYPGWKFAAGSWIPRLVAAGFEVVLHWLVPEDRWTVLDLDSGQLRWSAKHDHGFLLRSSGHYLSAPIVF